MDDMLARLIGGIYDAALDSSLWPEALARCAAFVGGSAAALFSKGGSASQGIVYHEAGTDPHYRKLYFEKYIDLDPTTAGQCIAEIDQPVAVSDLMPYDQFLETRFYREWVQPQRLVDCVNVVIEKSPTGTAMLCVFRHERDGVVDDEARRRMRLIVPHIRRSVMIGRLLDLKHAETSAFADLLDGLRGGMFLVDGRGGIVHANHAGRMLLDDGGILCRIGGRLAAAESRTDMALRDVYGAAEVGDESNARIGAKAIVLPLSVRNGETHIAHVMPLSPGARARSGASGAAAAVFVRKAAMDPVLSPETIAKIYKLTPTELRVLLAVVDIGGVPDVARALGVAETTVKTHLGRLFAKTGSARQADLVKLVAGFSSPLMS